MNNGQDWNEHTYEEAEAAIGYTFSDKELLKTCFTHSTYRNNVAHGGRDYERLEFLGDAVLQFFVSDKLFRRERKGDESKLTELRKGYVSKHALTPISKRLGLFRFLRHSNQESDLGEKIHSDLFEAVVAGIYLDGGLSAANAFLERNLRYDENPDYISRLQELAQSRGEGEPDYHIVSLADAFSAKVSVLGIQAEGKGKSKQEAKAEAARRLLEKWKERTDH